MAARVAAVRLSTPIFWKQTPRCCLAVFSLISRMAATSPLLLP
jgi:hypothetical protein